MTKRLRALVSLMLCVALLTGCTASTTVIPSATLPPASPGPQAPIGDAGLQQETIVALHLPSLDGQTLLTTYETLTLPRDQHPAQAILEELFSHPGNIRVQPLSADDALHLAGQNPVEIAGNVCTVNLSPTALRLSYQELYTAALAISATLCELEDVSYVCILAAGTPIAMDVGGHLPLGALNGPEGQTLPVAWEQFAARRTQPGELPAHTPLTAAAALYFPLENGGGIAAEPRRIAFPGQHPQQQVIALLAALSAGADTLEGAANMPDLNAMLLFAPEITDLESGGRRATLHFTADVEARIAAAGCDPVAVFACITTTLTTFVPSLQQVCVLVGDGALTSLYSPVLGSCLFPGGLMNRGTFAHTLMGQATVYVPEGSSLSPVTIGLPYRSAVSPRAVLLAMAQPGLAVLPEGLTDADILGLSLHSSTLLVHFSAKYAEVIRASEMDQRMMAYAMVTTLCEMLEVRRVRFYFGGEGLDSLGGDTVWSGEFLYNPALITH